jgi:hypothetical protein
MATLDTVKKAAEAQGLAVTKDLHWGQVRIMTSRGATLVVCGIDAAPSWIAGYAAGHVSVQACPNPACRGGFVGGDDPHACGQC